MTCLLRSRGSSSEMARLFAADSEAGISWRDVVWPGEQVPVVIQEGERRRLITMRWGLPQDAFLNPVRPSQRGIIYSRDFWRTGSRLDDVASLSRCLIILESFAYPAGEAGRCTRSWFGLWDQPLTAWAGICTPDGCAGVLVRANTVVETASEMMPRLLHPSDHTAWLGGATLLSLSAMPEDQEFYLENLWERWSTGSLPQEMPSRLIA